MAARRFGRAFGTLTGRGPDVEFNPIYITAFTGLIGVAVGGFTTFMTTWLALRNQRLEKHRDEERSKRETTFREFIDEASRLYADALTHDRNEIADLVKLYALVAHLRLRASRQVVAAAEGVMHAVVRTYLSESVTLREISVMAREGRLDFLVAFGDACRHELATMP